LDDRVTTAQSLLVTRHLQRQSGAIFPKPACIWRSDERDRNIGALHLASSELRQTVSRFVSLNPYLGFLALGQRP
jgi:hypothetical protein